MAQHVTRDDVRGIAEYARIGLREDELDAMTSDLNAIIDSLAPITEYDLEGVEPTFHPIGGLSNVMREDRAVPGLSRDVAMRNAPKQQDGAFLIPSILGAPPAKEGAEEGEDGARRAGDSGAQCAEEAGCDTGEADGCIDGAAGRAQADERGMR